MTVVRDEQQTHRWTAPALRWLAVLTMMAVVFWIAGRLSLPDRRVPGSTPADLGVEFESLQLITADGLNLAAWAVEPPGPVTAAVLVFHGKDGCRSPGRLALLAKAGLAGLSIDHRAHGESDGVRTSFGWFERHDVAAAVEEARRRWGDVPLVGWGTSQGAAALVFAVDPQDGVLPPDTFAGLLLESLYVDMDTAFRQRVEMTLGTRAGYWSGSMMSLAAWRSGLTGLELSPHAALTRLAAAGLSPETVLLASGAEDRHATPAELQQLADVLPGCAVELLAGLGHVDLLSQGTVSWRQTVVAFLEGLVEQGDLQGP